MESLEFRLRPPSGLPLPFFLVGLCGLLAWCVVAAADPRAALTVPLGPHGILLLHLAVLGFLTPVMMGAYYQLVPVVLHLPLRRSRCGLAVLACLVGGLALFLGGWAGAGGPWIAAGGALAALALYGFVAHLAATLACLRRLTVPALAFVLALAALTATATLGCLLALAAGGVLAPPGFGRLLPAHAAVGFGGWLLLTIVGASYRLLPFFAASEPGVRDRWGYAAVVFVAAGTLLLACGVVPAGLAGGLALAGLALWAYDLARLARHGRQARREPVVAATALGTAAVVVAASGAARLLAVGQAPGHAVAAWALLGVVAGPALLVTGQLQKIVPFVVALDSAASPRRRGGVARTERLFPRRTAWWLLLASAAGWFGVCLAAAIGSQPGLRLAAAVAALSTGVHLGVQARSVRVWWLARPPR